ncbi:MAG: hypothetical protein ABI548_02875 [Polyangiaceae bacterium]
MGDEPPKRVFTSVVAPLLEDERIRNFEEGLSLMAALRLPVKQQEVELAREEYELALNRARDSARRRDSLELMESARNAADICRTRYEYLTVALRAQAEESYAVEARELAKTNTKLAQGQTRIAIAVAAFTALQFALALAQALKWIKQ